MKAFVVQLRSVAVAVRAFDLGRFRRTWLAALMLGAGPGWMATATEIDESLLAPPAEKTIEFDRDIRPIFEVSCLRCHGSERPKGRFRLDNREAALKGGDTGAAILPGESAKSPLIHYVARLVEDMEMPPTGKGDPLTKEEVGLLRAWIDQGAVWSSAPTVDQNKIQFSIAPTLQWISVSGDERKFREHYWMREGWSGGLSEFSMGQVLGDGETITVEGRGILEQQDYRLTINYNRRDVGFASGGFEQYRKYFDDTGGYYPLFDPSAFHLNRDLQMEVGRAWAQFGLTLPDWPRMVLGYEYQYRDGTKSMLTWGDVVAAETGEVKKIYPSFKDVDERVHILTFDISHDLPWFTVEDNVRVEFYDLTTQRQDAIDFDLSTLTLDRYSLVQEKQSHWQAANSLRLEKQPRDWLFLSGGYLYSHLSADALFQQSTLSPINEFFYERFWSGQVLLLEQNSHVFNVNALLGPWDGFSISAGVQSEWMWQRGFGEISLDEGIPGEINVQPATVHADLNKTSFDEMIGLRYTKIPATVLFAEGRLRQEEIGQYEDQLGGPYAFLRDTEADLDVKEAKVGFQVSPWTRVSFYAHYKHRLRDYTYEHERDLDLNLLNSDGYPAFIRSRENVTDEFEAKLVYRAASWLKTTLSYQRVNTDYRTETAPYILPEIPPFPEEVFSPGGTVLAGIYDANVYSVSATLTPWRRVYLSGAFSYRDSRLLTADNDTPAVVPYEGHVYTLLSSATWVVNNSTDLYGRYNFSRSDYGQNNLEGVPYGIDYDLHGVTVGVTRRFKKNITTNLQYRFYAYDEPSLGGANDYQAHGVFATFGMILR